MFRTVVNIWGDATAVTCVDSWANKYEAKGMLNEAALAAGPHEAFSRGHKLPEDEDAPKVATDDSAQEGM